MLNYRRKYPHIPVMVLTACTEAQVLSDIEKVLGMNDTEYFHHTNFSRDNVTYP